MPKTTNPQQYWGRDRGLTILEALEQGTSVEIRLSSQWVFLPIKSTRRGRVVVVIVILVLLGLVYSPLCYWV